MVGLEQSANRSDAPRISSTDFPALQRAASELSGRSQKRYLRLFGVNLSLLVVASILAFTAAWNEGLTKQVLVVLTATTLAVTLVLSMLMRFLGYEKIWFGARAVAESVKSRAWRYMAGANPYERSLSETQAKTEFLDYIESIRKERAAVLSGELAGQPQITEAMRRLRNSSLQSRLDAYVSLRLEDQIRWYGKKAESSRVAGERFTLLSILAQLIALIFAVTVALYSKLPLNLISMFATTAASLIAWTQVKRHQELAHSYSSTAEELGLIRERFGNVQTDSDLSTLVDNAENTMTREHKLWLVRRVTG